MADPIQTSLKVPVREDTFEFRIPTIHDDIAIGSRATKLRRVIDPGWNGFDPIADAMAQYSLDACATMEVLLDKASVTWPFTPSQNGPIVDSSKFPADKVNDVLEAYSGFRQALATFRNEGNKINTTANQVVESKPNIGE
jgi:hypothetical protein